MINREGAKELKNGLNSKLNENAAPSLEINSKDNPMTTPKKIFLPRVISLLEPKTNSIASKIIAIRDIGLTILLYNSTSKTLALSLFSVKNCICLNIVKVERSIGSYSRQSINSRSKATFLS